MKYKVLLVGRNKIIMEDLFLHCEENFELQTSSMRYKDIVSHINYFKPDAIFFCMNKEEKERTAIVASLQDKLTAHRVALVLIGDQKECDDFKNANGGMGDLILKKPISARSINEKAAVFLGERKAAEAKDPLQSACDIANELLEEIGKDETLSSIAKQVEAAEAAAAAAAQSESQPVQAKPAATMQMQENAKAPEQANHAAPIQPDDPTKKHILVVDDDPLMLKLIKEQLKDSYTVATAINGIIALKFLESKKTDLILLDYEMPNQNGAQILERIRKNPATAKLPVVFLTGVKDREKIKKLVELKPQGYLLKPIEREELIKNIKSVIG